VFTRGDAQPDDVDAAASLLVLRGDLDARHDGDAALPSQLDRPGVGLL